MDEEKRTELEACLKPCPFCGGKAAFKETYSEYRELHYLRVACEVCHATSITFHMNHEATERELQNISERWNMRRAPQ